MCLVVSVFILCWSPYMLFDLLQVYELLPKNKTINAVATFIQSLAPLNSAANPLIYCVFSANIGKHIRLDTNSGLDCITNVTKEEAGGSLTIP